MKLYDYIYHPDPKSQGEYTIEGMDLDHECVTLTTGPVIVLTIEEAQELFNAGMKYCEGLETNNYNGRPDFTTYITSKGINTDNNGK